MRPLLSSKSAVQTVDNVVLFISDSIRFDVLPNRLFDLGVTFRTVSASTSTKSSLPSITSGKYPSNHGIWNFNGQHHSRPPLLDNSNVGFNAETIWTHLDPPSKPPMRMNHISGRSQLADLASPYVYVEHHKGGHSPYGKSFDEYPSSQLFFDHFSGDSSQIVDFYHAGVDQSVDRFLSVCEEVRNRGDLEETLLIFTSDHGELLGEAEYGGIWDHGSPVVPELVYVPTVFAGAGLPGGEMGDPLLSGTDIAPTAIAAMGGEVSSDVDGRNLWSGTCRENPEIRSEYLFEGREVSVVGHSRAVGGYEAISLWNYEGGVVLHRNSKLQRAINCHYTNLYGAAYSSVTRSGWTPRRHASMVRTYLPNEKIYGTPGFDDETVDWLREISFEVQGTSGDKIDDITREQLERLGYLD